MEKPWPPFEDDERWSSSLPMQWSIFEKGGGWRLDLAAPVNDGVYHVVHGYDFNSWGLPVYGVTVKDGQFVPAPTAQACYEAVCRARYGWTSAEIEKRSHIDHRFIESLRWDARNRVFVLRTGS